MRAWASSFMGGLRFIFRLFCVGEGAAEVGGVGDCVVSQDGGLLAGEEGEVQGAAGDVGDHPLDVFGAAEGVFAEESFCGGDVEAVEAAGSVGCAVGVEDGADLGGFEGADAGHDEAGEVDDEFFVGEGDVAGDGAGGVAGGTPHSFFLGGEGEGKGEEEQGGMEFLLHGMRVHE